MKQPLHSAYELPAPQSPMSRQAGTHGRMTATMATTRDTGLDFAAIAAALAADQSLESLASPLSLDLTTWLYDEATGLLTNKLYADGKGTAYSYTPDGKLAARIWARGVTTSYTYTNGSSLVAIDYSDDTPDGSFAYDRLGRQISAIVDGVSTNLFTYDGDGTLTSEAVSAGGEHVLTRLRDGLGRDGGWTLATANGLLAAASYRYDDTGLFDGLSWSNTWDATGVNVDYTRDYGLITGRTVQHGAGTLVRTTWNHELRGLITAVENTVDAGAGANTISRYDYVNDALGRRTSISRSGQAFGDLPAHDAYGYNARSEVTSARRYLGTDHGNTQTPVRGFAFDYGFDPIGNRISASTYSPANEARTRTYTANALNQYTQATVPGYAAVRGMAVTNATVTVNELPAWRLDEYFYGESPATNTAAPAWQQMRIAAVVNPPGTNDPDVVSCVTGRVFVAETPEAFTYDNDGNLLSDGRFTYTWDAENRLAGVETRAAAVAAGAPKVRITYAYDHQSRRIATARETWGGSTWQTTGASRFLYDAWNVVAELTHTQSQTLTNLYSWALDLSGSLQGAGGIGGLLAASLDGTTAFYCHDANGNVGQLVSTDGDLLAHYEYSPFGETIVSTGPLGKANSFRFSTKWFDNETGFGYWGYRWYSPGMGRWLCYDMVDFGPDISLYAAFQNSSSYRFDKFGLASVILKPAKKETATFPNPLQVGHHKGWLEPNAVGIVDSSSSCKCQFTVGTMIHSGLIQYYENQNDSQLYLTLLEEGMHHKISETVAYFVAAASTTQRSCKYKSKQTQSTCEAKAKKISKWISGQYDYFSDTINHDVIDKQGTSKETKEELLALFKIALLQATDLQKKAEDWKCPDE